MKQTRTQQRLVTILVQTGLKEKFSLLNNDIIMCKS